MTVFNLNYLFEGPISEYSHIWLQNKNLEWGAQFNS